MGSQKTRVEFRRICCVWVSPRGAEGEIIGSEVGVQVDVIEKARAVSLLVGCELLKVVLDERNAAVGIAIDGIAPRFIARPPSGGPAGFNVFLRIEVGPPEIDDGTADFSGGIGSFDGGGVGDAVIGDFVVGEGRGVHIAVHAIPPRRLIVEVVDGNTAVGRSSKFADQIRYPALRPGGIDGDAGIGGGDAGDVAAAGIRATTHALRVESVPHLRP